VNSHSAWLHWTLRPHKALVLHDDAMLGQPCRHQGLRKHFEWISRHAAATWRPRKQAVARRDAWLHWSLRPHMDMVSHDDVAFGQPRRHLFGWVS